MVPVDIIIVNYNSTEYLVKCIESIYHHLDSARINIFVEDNESNNTIEVVEKKFREVTIQRNTKNLGFGAAINKALRKCKAPYVVLLNPDTILPDGSLKKAVEYLSMNNRVGVIGPRIYEHDGSIQGSARRFPTLWTSIFGRKSPLTKLFPQNPITKREFICFDCVNNEDIDVDWVSGACMIIRRKAIQQISGFDERFFLYWEDTDLCKRIKEAGWRIVYFPKAQIYHSVGKSSETRAIRSIFHFHRSCFRLFVKHSKVPVNLMMPFVFSGLTARCIFVIALHFIGRAFVSSSEQKAFRMNKNKKIKIIRIVSRLNIGGPSIHVSLLTRKMDPQRFETILLTGTISPSEGDMSYLMNNCNGKVRTIHELQREINLARDIVALFKILLIIAKERPNIIHTHMSKAGTIGRIAAALWKLFADRNLKIVHTFHGHVLEGYFSPTKSSLFKLIEIAMARVTNAIIAISQSQQWELTQKYRIANSDKVKVINLGFDLAPFIETFKFKWLLRKSLAIGKDTLIVGIVGRLVPIKNHRMFLEGAKRFIARNPNIDARFVIVGDGELRKYLENYVLKLEIRDKVFFLGWEKELRKIYADLDILALTSINEGTPVSIIEAMAASVLVITTGVGGVRDLLGNFRKIDADSKDFKECERGILCPKNSEMAFAEGLQFIVDNGLSKDSTRISNARNYVFKNYSEDRLVKKMETLYERLIGNK